MPDATLQDVRSVHDQEFSARSVSGIPMLILNIILMIGALVLFIRGIGIADAAGPGAKAGGIIMLSLGGLYFFIIGPILFNGLKIIRPNEAAVLTLFGRYCGTLRNEGFYYVHPLASAVAPAGAPVQPSPSGSEKSSKDRSQPQPSRRLSLKAMTLNNEKQKINDLLGNPINIGIVVIWRVVNTAKAVFNVDDYKVFLSIQSDSALRNIVRNYPYDVPGDDSEMSLRGSSLEVAERIKREIQDKVEIAGLEILEARITHLAYASEIAAAMLQRQQASAIIDARQMIVEGAVGMVEMALDKLSRNQVVELDEERKAAMVSNLLVVLCGNRDAQPVVNSGSIY